MDKDIFTRPWFRYRITNFTYEFSSEDFLDHYIDLSFTNGNEFYKLRFEAPRQLIIEEGFPIPTSGFKIIDVRDRQLENINVQVGDFENSEGVIKFLAKGVVFLK